MSANGLGDALGEEKERERGRQAECRDMLKAAGSQDGEPGGSWDLGRVPGCL